MKVIQNRNVEQFFYDDYVFDFFYVSVFGFIFLFDSCFLDDFYFLVDFFDYSVRID